MSTFEERVAKTVSEKMNDGTVEKLVADAAEKALKESINEQFRWNGTGWQKMGRLIDADKLILHLNDYALQEAPFGRNDSENQKEIYETIQECMKAVEEQPTAFDVEKVVALLEEELKLADDEKARCIKENPIQFDSAKGYAHGIAVAIEIVKRGGRDGK